MCLCVAELNDVDPDELRDKWMNAVDRGGLKHVSDMTFTMFTSAEVDSCTPHIYLRPKRRSSMMMYNFYW